MQNDIKFQVIDSGCLCNIFFDLVDFNFVYVLFFSGGFWKIINFEVFYLIWILIMDKVIIISGGVVVLGWNLNIVYFGIGDFFDGILLVGGVMLKMIDGGSSWLFFMLLFGVGMVLDIKVDLCGVVDVVLVGIDVGVFCLGDGGVSYSKVLIFVGVFGICVWSLVCISVGWLVILVFGGYYLLVMFYCFVDGISWQLVNVFVLIGGVGCIMLVVGQLGDVVVYVFVVFVYLGG